MIPPVLLVMLDGCASRDADVHGTWTAWVNVGSPLAEQVAPQEGAVAYECSGAGWDEGTGSWDDDYIGPREGDDGSDPRYFGGACAPDDAACDATEAALECDQVGGLALHTFLQQQGYFGLSGELAPMETTAILSADGTLQLALTQDLGGDLPLQLWLSVASDFAPMECVADATGQLQARPVDDADWVEQWSADEDGYRIYYLNAGAYQAPFGDPWYLPDTWLSGAGYGTLGGVNLYSLPPLYGTDAVGPEFYDGSWWGSNFVGVQDFDAPDLDRYDELAAYLGELAEGWSAELNDVAGARQEPGVDFHHKVEDNRWREIDDGTVRGLDGWLELHSSWVRLADSSQLQVGGAVTGDFQVLLSSAQGPWVVVSGSFQVDRLRDASTGYGDFEQEQREQAGEPFCGG